jgi:hypothetical protein
MSFEKLNLEENNQEEEKIIDLTEEEAKILSEGDENNPEVQKLMEEKGIPSNEKAASLKVRINGVVQEVVNEKGLEEMKNKWLKESSSGIAEILNKQFSEGVDFVNESDIKEQYLSFLEQEKPTSFSNKDIINHSSIAQQVVLAGARLAIEDLKKKKSLFKDNNRETADKIEKIKRNLGDYMIRDGMLVD